MVAATLALAVFVVPVAPAQGADREKRIRQACAEARSLLAARLLAPARDRATAVTRADEDNACAKRVLAAVRGEERARSLAFEQARTYRRAATLARGSRLARARALARSRAMLGYVAGLSRDPMHRGARQGLRLMLIRQAGVVRRDAANARCDLAEDLTAKGLLAEAGIAQAQALRAARSSTCRNSLARIRDRRAKAHQQLRAGAAAEAAGDGPQARQAFIAALERDPGLASAWAGLTRVKPVAIPEDRNAAQQVSDWFTIATPKLPGIAAVAVPVTALLLLALVPLSIAAVAAANRSDLVAGAFRAVPGLRRFGERGCDIVAATDADGEPSKALAHALQHKLRTAVAADPDGAKRQVVVSSRPTDAVSDQAAAGASLFETVGAVMPGAGGLASAWRYASSRVVKRGVQVAIEEVRAIDGLSMLVRISDYRGRSIRDATFAQAAVPALSGQPDAVVRDALVTAAADLAMKEAVR